MPKFPKAFTRRKSTANAFEEVENDSPVEHTFKVFDRGSGDSGNKSFDGGVKLAKPSTNGHGMPKPAQGGEDNMFENLGKYRASGGSNSNTASTTDNSSRLSAASTAASSTDLPGRDDHRSYIDKNSNPPAKAISAFSLKNAGRSLSWGRSKPPTPTTSKDSNLKELPSLPPRSPGEDASTSRSRAVTASSYASTATPPKLEDKHDLGLNLGGDFSEMFSSFGKRKSVVLQVEQDRVMSRSPDVLPPAPTNRVARFNSPQHLNIDRNDKSKETVESPYSWTSQNSNDGLMSNRSPPPPKDVPPPVPQHGKIQSNGVSQPAASTARPGATSADGLRRGSAVAGRRQSTLDYTGDSNDEDIRLLRESANASRKMNEPGYSSKVRDSWALPSTSSTPTSYQLDDSTANWRAGLNETTPKSKQTVRQATGDVDNMFDSQIAASANLAEKFQEKSSTPIPRPDVPNRVMTPGQFERYKQDQERLRSIGGQSKDDDDEDEDYDDDEDEAEKAKQLAKQRRKQEAHMAVYRQQMMKVTGEAVPRPGLPASYSSPNLVLGKAEEGEEEDEEVPLAILQAHGFPNKNKPPMRSMGSNPNLRASVIQGGGEGGRLPVFARHLPQDPYLGAGLQSPMHRESMAFAGGAPSVAGGPPRGTPGGLVGVIATEERSRALRRGSPNAHNSGLPNMYGPPQMGPMGPMGMNPMMMGPGQMGPGPDQAQAQLTQQMQQFMQMQLQFMQMMASGQSQAGGAPGEPSRPSSSQHLRPGSGQPAHQRAMTMMEPNAAPWMQPGSTFAPSIHIQGYSPSIAPSERSTVGMPGRYRPVSHMPAPIDNKSRLSTMSGIPPNWETKHVPSPTVRAVQKSGTASDEDDEEGWEEMAKKREKKKSMWKSKRDTDGFKDMLNFN